MNGGDDCCKERNYDSYIVQNRTSIVAKLRVEIITIIKETTKYDNSDNYINH